MQSIELQNDFGQPIWFGTKSKKLRDFLEIERLEAHFSCEITLSDTNIQFPDNKVLEDLLYSRLQEIQSYQKLIAQNQDRLTELEKFDQFIQFYEENDGQRDLMREQLVQEMVREMQ